VRILIVDNDLDLLDLIGYVLRRVGYEVVTAMDGLQALERFELDRPDLILLDANLPKLDGFEVCRRIRLDTETPVIMLTARDDEEDVVRGLSIGADDYVTKPFSARQLTARIATVLRRARPDAYHQQTREVRAGQLALDLQSHEVTKNGAVVHLTPLEFRILHLLALNEGRVIPHARLVEYAWGYEGGDASLLKSHICHLRSKLDLTPGGSGSIRSVPGVGYSLAKSA
jgi:DNA-binding response OmpR family regulator